MYTGCIVIEFTFSKCALNLESMSAIVRYKSYLISKPWILCAARIKRVRKDSHSFSTNIMISKIRVARRFVMNIYFFFLFFHWCLGLPSQFLLLVVFDDNSTVVYTPFQKSCRFWATSSFFPIITGTQALLFLNNQYFIPSSEQHK